MNVKTITNTEASDNLRHNLANVRMNLGLSQEDFAKQLGWSKSTLQRLESGEKSLDASLLEIKLYNKVGLTYFDLMEVEDERINLCRKIRRLEKPKFEAVKAIVKLIEEI